MVGAEALGQGNFGGAASQVKQHLSAENVFRVSAGSVFLMFFAVMAFFREPQKLGDTKTASFAETGRNFWKVCTNPKFMLTLYEHARCAQWSEALKIQAFIARFFDDVSSLIENRGEGTSDPVFDKGLSVASGCLLGSTRTRAPYIGWREETVQAVREWLLDRYPQFIFPDA